MAEEAQSLDRARRESRIMAEIAGLPMTDQTYDDTVQAILDLVEQVVSSPFLSLTIDEVGQTGFYVRRGDGVDPVWADDIARHVAQLQQRRTRGVSRVQRSAKLAAWIAAFPAESRSGRTCVLTLACPRPLVLEEDEEQLMLRLARQVLLVLDHALLTEQLERLETMDGLTGVANHLRLLEILDYEMLRHRFLGRRLALLLLDIEGLDAINRSYGRQYGNHILSKLAGLLRETVRPIDVIARCGMDEFAVVLPEMDEEEARQLAERLHERVLNAGFAGESIGLSAGVAHLKPDEMLSAEGLLRRAEQALYEAKRQERDWSERVAGRRRVPR